MNIAESTIRRFWDKVDVRGPDDCWEWQASTQKFGYGQLHMKTDKGKTVSSAHRISWCIKYGEIPRGMCVLHKCDNPKCVNPKHLFIGTRGDNVRDAVKKGRHVSGFSLCIGVKNVSAKLTPSLVKRIRRMYKSGKYTYNQIIDILDIDVDETLIGYVVNRKIWRHI